MFFDTNINEMMPPHHLMDDGFFQDEPVDHRIVRRVRGWWHARVRVSDVWWVIDMCGVRARVRRCGRTTRSTSAWTHTSWPRPSSPICRAMARTHSLCLSATTLIRTLHPPLQLAAGKSLSSDSHTGARAACREQFDGVDHMREIPADVNPRNFIAAGLVVFSLRTGKIQWSQSTSARGGLRIDEWMGE